MQCPKDQTNLRERERDTAAGDAVVMDVCPTWGGIWLDKGELERLTASEGRFYRERYGDREGDDADDGGGLFGGRGGRGGRDGRQGRRGSFLGGLFGGDDD